jgi:hypothetical protein
MRGLSGTIEIYTPRTPCSTRPVHIRFSDSQALRRRSENPVITDLLIDVVDLARFTKQELIKAEHCQYLKVISHAIRRTSAENDPDCPLLELSLDFDLAGCSTGACATAFSCIGE